MHVAATKSPKWWSIIDADIDGVITLFDDFNHGTHGAAGRFPMAELIALKERVEKAVKFIHRLVR